MMDEEYVKQFCPRAEVRKIEPQKDSRFISHNKIINIKMPTRYFVGTFHGNLAVAVHSGSMQTPEDAWADAKKKILKYVLARFEE